MPFQTWWKSSQTSDVNEDVVDEDQDEEEIPTEPAAPAATYTRDDLQTLLDNQAKLFTQGLEQTVSRFVKPVAPDPDPDDEPIQAPTHKQLKEAAEEGDWDKYFALQEQREAAVYQASVRESRKEIKRLRSEGMSFINQTNDYLVKQQVPDFDEYKEDVAALAAQLGLDAATVKNPQVAAMLTSTVRGRPENIEKEVQKRIEAQKRQRNGDGTTSDVSSAGRQVGRGQQDREPVFTSEGLRAIQETGKDPNQVARGMGYKDWASYETAAVAVQSDDRSVPKWRRPKAR